MMLQRNCLFFCYCWACHFHICLVLTSLLHYFILLFFFSFSFSLVCQCLSVVQMKYHILLLSIYCVLYFGCILKYSHTMFKKKKKMAGWHHRLDGREFEWTPGVGDGQGGLACCNSWGWKESDTTEQLNRAEHWKNPTLYAF